MVPWALPGSTPEAPRTLEVSWITPCPKGCRSTPSLQRAKHQLAQNHQKGLLSTSWETPDPPPKFQTNHKKHGLALACDQTFAISGTEPCMCVWICVWHVIMCIMVCLVCVFCVMFDMLYVVCVEHLVCCVFGVCAVCSVYVLCVACDVWYVYSIMCFVCCVQYMLLLFVVYHVGCMLYVFGVCGMWCVFGMCGMCCVFGVSVVLCLVWHVLCCVWCVPCGFFGMCFVCFVCCVFAMCDVCMSCIVCDVPRFLAPTWAIDADSLDHQRLNFPGQIQPLTPPALRHEQGPCKTLWGRIFRGFPDVCLCPGWLPLCTPPWATAAIWVIYWILKESQMMGACWGGG